MPCQILERDRWGDGSLRWIYCDALATASSADTPLTVEVTTDRETASDVIGVKSWDEAGRVIVDTGAARFTLGAGGRSWLLGVESTGSPSLDVESLRLHATDHAGDPLDVTISTVDLEDIGPVRTSVLIRGALSKSRQTVLNWQLRLHFFAGHAAVRHELTIVNPSRAEHRGGFWELGDSGSVRLTELSMGLRVSQADDGSVVRCWPELRSPALHCSHSVSVYQESSGEEAWNSSNHITAEGTVALRFRGYSITIDGKTDHGLQATPILQLQQANRSLAVAFPDFWQNFPRSLEFDGNTRQLTLGLFPRQSASLHEIQGGEQKTHVFTIAFGADGVSDNPLDWCREPLRFRAEPSWYCSTAAVKYLVPAEADPNHGYLELVQTAIEGPHSFEAKRRIIDEYGWRNFGELYGDHEAVNRQPGDPPLVSHYNNQYDGVAGCAIHFLRTGDWRWWQIMDDLARHVGDIDVYHTSEDKAAYNNGLFWHTEHYQDAAKATHRTFPRVPGVHGGGPSPDHNYTTGLLLHYFLTGSRQSRDAAIGLARWIVAMDDGGLTPFKWLDSGPTGLVTMAGAYLEQGPGRAAGNSVNGLLDGFHLSGDRALLAKADELIRRCVHPSDDVAARDLLDAELRWYYTVFLQAVGKFLDWKAELGELDESYAYARASLCRYAKWMAEHEVPYLSRPERLQYPTETWAAQDMRKSDVLMLASLHASPEDRPFLLQRGAQFFEYSIETLRSRPTKILTRPVVLMLTNGYRYAWFQTRPEASAPLPATTQVDFGRPQRFLPQRTRAIRRAKRIAGGFVLAVVLVLVYLLTFAVRP